MPLEILAPGDRPLRAEEDHPVVLSHGAKYRSLLPSLALIVHLIDSVEAGTGGPVSRAAAERAVAWCLVTWRRLLN